MNQIATMRMHSIRQEGNILYLRTTSRTKLNDDAFSINVDALQNAVSYMGVTHVQFGDDPTLFLIDDLDFGLPNPGKRGDFFAVVPPVATTETPVSSNSYEIENNDRPGDVLLAAGVHRNKSYHNPTLKLLISILRKFGVRRLVIEPFASANGTITVER